MTKRLFKIAALGTLMVMVGAVSSVMALPENRGISLGVGGAASSRLYKDFKNDKRYMPIPFVMGELGKFYVDGIKVGVKVVDEQRLTFAVEVSQGSDGYKASDSPALKGMKERKKSIDGGVRITCWSDIGGFELSGAGDLSDTHEGGEATLKYMIPIQTPVMTVVPYVGSTWRSKKKVAYYFGVRDVEAKAGRKAYEPGADVSGFVGLDVEIPVTRRLKMVVGGKAEYLGDEVHNSPIVNEDYVASAYAGMILTMF